MTTQMIICFAISAVVIAGYIWNKLSVGTVGCIGIVLFLLTGCIGPKDILGNIGNANLVMITSMFVISEGFKRTKAIHLVASTVKKKNLEAAAWSWSCWALHWRLLWRLPLPAAQLQRSALWLLSLPQPVKK